MKYLVVLKYTGRVVYQGEDKQAAKAAYKRDPGGSWVYKNVKYHPNFPSIPSWAVCDLRTFEPKIE